MRYRILLPLAAFLTISAVFSAPASATQVGYGKTFGIGAMLGEPSGLTMKFFIANANAIDAGIGFFGYGYGQHCWVDDAGNTVCDNAYGSYGAFSMHADYLWQSNIVKAAVQLDWHVGVGGRLFFWDWNNDNYYGNHSMQIAARVPVGLDLMFRNPDFLETYFEIAPSLALLGPYFFFDWDIGVRFYF